MQNPSGLPRYSEVLSTIHSQVDEAPSIVDRDWDHQYTEQPSGWTLDDKKIMDNSVSYCGKGPNCQCNKQPAGKGDAGIPYNWYILGGIFVIGVWYFLS